MAMRWYVVHVYSGFEKKVAQSIHEQARAEGPGRRFEEVLVPTEEVVEVRRGEKVNAERKFFPGYVLVKMEHERRGLAPGEEHAEGDRLPRRPRASRRRSRKPRRSASCSQVQGGHRAAEAVDHLRDRRAGAGLPTARSPRSTAWSRRSTRKRARLKVAVSIFGRATPVELEYSQVEKV